MVEQLVVDWPSTAAILDSEERLFGTAYRESLVRTFEDQIAAAMAGDDTFRYVESGAGRVVASVVGPGGFTQVKVRAHNFESDAQLAAAVAAGWADVHACDMEVFREPGRLAEPGAPVVSSIYAARCVDMAEPDGKVDLVRFGDLKEAMDIITECWRYMQTHDPSMRALVDIPVWAEISRLDGAGELWSITADGECVGVLGVSASSDTGALQHLNTVELKFVSPRHRGNGYATSAQTLWARRAVEKDPNAVMSGMIFTGNTYSRDDAIRAGRRAMLDRVRIQLVHSDSAALAG